MWSVELDPVLELYGLPAEQFIAARNQLAGAFPGAGDTRASAAVKALRKPTVAAWLANRLVRIAPDRIAELTEFGDDLREAHRTGDRDRLKELTPRRHEMVGGLVDAAREDAAAPGRRSVPPRLNVSGPCSRPPWSIQQPPNCCAAGA